MIDTPHPQRPNVILITTDQQRWDTLGCSGSPIIQSPHLDRLAASGTRFDYHFVQNPVCVPSRCSILTGRYPTAHRSRDLKTPLRSSEKHLLGLFKDAGYRVGLIGKNHALQRTELERLDYLFEAGHRKSVPDISGGAYASSVDPTPVESYTTFVLRDHTQTFLKEYCNDPFFLWLSFPDPHTPFAVPEPYASLYDWRTLPEPRTVAGELDTKPLAQRITRRLQGMEEASLEELLRLKAMYYGMVTCIDDAVGSIMETLSALGLRDNSLIVFTSDHGEYLGDHGLVRKGWDFYDALLRVPMLLSWPDRIRSHSVNDSLTESIDIAPTLLDACGIEAPQGIQGQSLLPSLIAEEGCEAAQTKAFVGAVAGNPGDRSAVRSMAELDSYVSQGINVPFWQVGATQGKMVRTKRWKLARYLTGEGELYDLQNDPDELENLFNDPRHSETQKEMNELLLHWSFLAEDPLPGGGGW